MLRGSVDAKLRGGLLPGCYNSVYKIIAGLRHMNRWKADLYFTWVMIIFAPVHGKRSVVLCFLLFDSCLNLGIIHETTAPYTPQQNGVAERKNRALKEMVNSMLSYSSLSEGFWGEAMLTACYLLNRVPNKRNKTTPYELCIEEDPRTYNEAMQSRDSAFWKEAIDDEIGSIMENNTWVLSDLPPAGCKPFRLPKPLGANL
ncbi:zinc finger, CCHC-type containing protein [Tanacetum coccineum]